MPHIDLPPGVPGISGAFSFRPETAGPLRLLVETLLRDDNSLSRGERELIAAYVSGLNECQYCYGCHSAFAAAQLPGGMELVEEVRADAEGAPVTPKLKALLAIAAAVQQTGQAVTEGLVAAARDEGATDVEIHDTVLIAAAFCMFNRYVDGLGTIPAADPSFYTSRATSIVEQGYVATIPASPQP